MIASSRAYANSIIRSGGVPVLVPLNLPQEMLSTLLVHLDGIVFTGGGDVGLDLYEGEAHEKVSKADTERDRNEKNLVHEVVERKKPLLGICRGLQIVNVAFGGSLYSHVLDQVENALEHQCFPCHPRDYLAHTVEVRRDSQLYKILGRTQISVNSMHHQGIKKLGMGLVSTAWAPDGLAEAVELQDYPFGLAVQWHPECLPEKSDMRALFDGFIEVARGAE